MKKLMIVGIASVLSVSLAYADGAATELRTVVYNNSKKGEMWATWKSSSTLGSIGTTITHGFGAKQHRYLQIPAGKKYTMAHTGDKLHVYMYPCQGKYVKFKATLKGYQRMDVDGTSGNITITQSVDKNKKGVTTGGTVSAVSELRTHVYNNTDGDIWATWKSATTQGKIFTTPFHWMREHRFVLIKPGESYAMAHTGDKLSIFYYPCTATQGEYKTKYKGYARMDVDEGAVISESISSSKKGVTP